MAALLHRLARADDHVHILLDEHLPEVAGRLWQRALTGYDLTVSCAGARTHGRVYITGVDVIAPFIALVAGAQLDGRLVVGGDVAVAVAVVVHHAVDV